MKKWLLAKTQTKPDLIIYRDGEYLRRWYIIPRNRFFNIYLHQFIQSDLDIALHTHPWLFNISWVLEEYYVEWTGEGKKLRAPGDVVFRWRESPHRIELFPKWEGGSYTTTTLFITGPRIRSWGFLCPKGYKDHKEVVVHEGGTVRAREGACE